MPSSTVEDYLKCILLEEQRRPERPATTGRLASVLEVAPGTVTAMMKTLADSGLVEYEPYAGVRLSAAGRQLALHVQRRHRLIELFLVQIMGMDWSEVHPEAERLEHAVSDLLVERMDEMLGHPSVDPHGDPIPDRSGQHEQRPLRNLLRCPLQRRVGIVRVADQDPAFLQLLEREGLKPGEEVEVVGRSEAAETVTVARRGKAELVLGYGSASKILVEDQG
jgi:DtxR family Mn-dependent transcriptional regulator